MEKAEMRISKLTNELDEAAQREQFREGEERLAMLRVKEEMAKKKLVNSLPESSYSADDEKRRKYEILKKHVESRRIRDEEKQKAEKLEKYAILKAHQEKREGRRESEKQRKYAILKAHQEQRETRKRSEKQAKYEILKAHQQKRDKERRGKEKRDGERSDEERSDEERSDEERSDEENRSGEWRNEAKRDKEWRNEEKRDREWRNEEKRAKRHDLLGKPPQVVQHVIQAAEASVTNVQDTRRIAELEAINRQYEEQLRNKEAEVVKAKSDTFANVLATITAPQAKGSSNLVDRVAELQIAGQNREQEKLKDLLELKAVSVVLNDATKRVNEQQKSLLEKANAVAANNVVELVKKDASPPLILQNLGHHQRLNIALQANNIRSQNQLWREEEGQSQYQHQLQHELMPKLQELGDRLENVKVPEMNKFKKKVRQELSSMITDSARDEAVPLTQARSELERKLQQMTREADELADSVRAYIGQPGPQTRENVLEIERQRLEEASQKRGALASMSTLEAQRRMEDIYSQDFRVARDSQPVRSQKLLLAPELTPFGQVPKPFDVQEALSVSSRSSRVSNPSRNLLVISHAHVTNNVTTDNRTDKTDAAKFVVFQKTLQTMWDQVIAIAVENQLTMRLVQISDDGTRSDLLARHALPKNCSAVNCQATRFTIKNLLSEEEVMKVVASHMPSDEDNSHLVLSLSSKGSDLSVHIVELLFKEQQKTPEDELKSRLLDKTWVDFLRPILVQTDTGIVIQQIVLPQSMTSTNHSNEMLKNMNSLREFLTRLRQNN
jgi:hypothetical protein